MDMYNKKQEAEKWKSENWVKYEKKEIKNPEMTYKMKNDDQSIHISKSTTNIKNNKISFYKGTFGNDGFKIKNRLLKVNKKTKETKEMRDNKLSKLFKNGINHDMKLTKTVTGKYYLCISTDNEIKPKREKIKVTAIDVGARTPYVSYSENECYEFGTGMSEKLKEMINERKRLRKIYESEISKRQKGDKEDGEYNKSKTNYLSYEEKIRNRIEDFHNKVITKLVKEYSIILIPKLNTKKIMERRDVHKTTKKMFSILSHSLFLKRLENKCKQEGVILKIVNEDMTTQTCGRCFSTYKFKEEIYKCSKCNLIIGRDINSARNIYIKEICKMVEFVKYMRSKL
jgi:IS605 OrfB family transposase